MNDTTLKKFSRHLVMVCTVLVLSLITWLPKLLDTDSSGDEILSNAGRQIICNAGPITGWPINGNSFGTQFGAFAPNVASFMVIRVSCALSHLLSISSHQAFLATGIGLTVVITIGASLACGLGLGASLFVGYGLATAPASFARLSLGHIELAQLWTIMPCIATCAILLARDDYPIKQPRPLYSSSLFGLFMGLWSFTAQDYYAVFSIISIFTCYLIGTARAARATEIPKYLAESSEHHKRIKENQLHYTIIAGGYILSMFLFLISKKLLWEIPAWAFEGTQRPTIDSLTCAFWPLNIITSPLINWALLLMLYRADLPVSETPLGSSSGILVAVALIITLITWINANKHNNQRQRKGNVLIIIFGSVLLALIAIALIVATAGGLGTLFAVFVSPQLRCLNRFTPFFYCASLAVCAIKLDQIMALAMNSYRKERGA